MKITLHNTKRSFRRAPLGLLLLVTLPGCGTALNDSDPSVAKGADQKVIKLADVKSGSQDGRFLEHLNRGLVAIPSDKGVLVSWRQLYQDPDGLSFSVYRNGELISEQPINGRSNFMDPEGKAGDEYQLKTDGQIVDVATTWSAPYLEIPLDVPEDGVTPDGDRYHYTANDASVGDLDGDGQYEIILKWDPSNAKDNSQGGYTGNALIDAYTLDGERLWRIDLGRNIRSGAHYTQFMVYDFDGDGRAEIAMKTADGTVDGEGNVIGSADADWVSHSGNPEVRDRTGSKVTEDGRYLGELKGRILKGPEYFSVFDGETGRVLDTKPYIPQRAPGNDNPTMDEMKSLWGDGYGNRSERYLAGVAFLDGEMPSIVMARGYYERTVIAAYDFRDGEISTRWTFDTLSEEIPDEYAGQGNHQLSVADIDGDRKDEIIYGAMAVDHDGSPKWSTGFGHGDALHVSDLDPENPGLEVFGVYEDIRGNGGIGSALIDAQSGRVLWTKSARKDNGRGLAANIDPRFPGAEVWALNAPELFDINGKSTGAQRPGPVNFAVWWDGDLQRELLNHNTVYKWNWETEQVDTLMEASGMTANNGTKATPALSGDIFGDWREEIILRSEDNRFLRIYSTPIPSEHGFTTLMHDLQYRLAIAWQNTSYNQPPHPSFYIGSDHE
ncbi:rhamnogalacturonan lyase [Marinimicrobium koreense]|jgi:rhamnogalacturonan endolyase|uniref:rhamnogalacturonan lyase n=1 Tax=Marinimicrobium koreense TaxID=306545 RepID=UPI003F6F5CAB